MRWSTGFMLVGVLVIALGLVPLLTGHLTLGSAVSAAFFFTLGIFLFLVGVLLRKVRKAFERPSRDTR